MKTTAELIRCLMDLGVSQGEMSRRLGIVQPNLSRWLSGGSKAGDDALRLLELCTQAEAGPLPPRPLKGAESTPPNPASNPATA